MNFRRNFFRVLPVFPGSVICIALACDSQQAKVFPSQMASSGVALAESLEALKSEKARRYTNTITETRIGGRKALAVAFELPMKRGRVHEYYVVNRAGRVIEFRFPETVPLPVAESIMKRVRLLPASRHKPGALTRIYGTVRELTGNCQPPLPCHPRPMATDVVARPLGPDRKPGEVAARARSNAAGEYELHLAPGLYTIRAVSNAEEHCKSSGAQGPCGLWVTGQARAFDIRVDNAVW